MPYARVPRKRQTRLDFSPLPDSSPAKQAQPEAVRSRAAGVVIDEHPSPAKRRKTGHQPFPTPEASSAPAASPTVHKLSSSSRKTRSFMHSSSHHRSSPDVRSSPSEASRLRNKLHETFPSDSDSDRPIAPTRSSQRSVPVDVISSDEDDLAETTPRRRRLARRSSPLRKYEEVDVTPPRSNQGTKSSPISGTDDEDNSVFSAKTPRRLKRRKPSTPPTGSEEGSVGAEVSSASSARSFVHKGGRPSNQIERPKTSRRGSLEEADLQEDLDFFAPSSDDENGPQKGRPMSAAKSAKQKALETLRKRRQRHNRRAGQASNARVSASDDEDDEQEIAYATEDEEPTAEDWDAHDEPEQDWIVDEDDGDEDADVQTTNVLRLLRMKPKELFIFAVEWFVQKKINPAFDRDDDAYRIAFNRLSDFVNGMGGSKFRSSAWTAMFLRSLLARPVLQETPCLGEAMLRDRCDACNRSGHPTTYEVMFQGKPYDNRSLEEFSDDEDNTGQETELPDATKVYFIGKFCMRNARVAHQLHHWRFHLNEWIVDYLEDQGHLTPDKILHRDRQSTRKRNDTAIEIVEEMQKSGEIRNLYRDFKHEIDAAQHGEGAGSSHLADDSD